MAEKVAPTTSESQPETITAEQYMAEYAHDHYEWVRGELIKMSPVTEDHDEITGYLYILLRTYLELRPIGKIRREPFVMHVNVTESRREPDLQIILHGNVENLTKTAMVGPADICIEVVSPESVSRDHGEKFEEYEKGGVREYWIIDPIRRQCRFNRLTDDGVYVTEQMGTEGVYQSELLPDLALDVSVLWGDKLPDISSIVDQVKAMVEVD